MWAEEYEKITVRTLLAAPSIYVTANKDSVELSWSKVQGATGYVVYYCSSKNGTYKKLATVKSTSYTSEKINADDSYYFKVRAYTKVSGSNVYGDYSVVKGI